MEHFIKAPFHYDKIGRISPFWYSMVRQQTSRRCFRLSEAGASLIGAIILALLVGLVAVAIIVQTGKVKRDEQKVYGMGAAQVFASELAEYFRSYQRGSDFLNFLRADVALAGYRFCAPINFLNRTSGVRTNPHALAEGTVSVLRSPNRYYKVEVRDMTIANPDAAVVQSACAATFSAPPVLTAQQRIVVTVGVTWLPPLREDPSEVSLVTILPEN